MAPPPELRPARDSDLPALADVFGRPAFLSDCLSRQRAGRGAFIVALIDDLPVGHLYVRWEPAEEPELRERLPNTPLLQHLVVAGPHRNRRTGSALVGYAEGLVRDRGLHRVALGVGLDNHDAVRLYERLGFTEWPYPPVDTVNDEYLPDQCRIFVKNLAML
jgi:GNAT superfamily N-acetyltransferase